MPRLSEIYFVSSNKNKFLEIKQILHEFGIKVNFFKKSLLEIQSTSLQQIAKHKSLSAFESCKKPLIVEDDGLFIDSLHGFPGPYSSFVFDTIGNDGILKLLRNNRKAQFVSVISYCDNNLMPKNFVAKTMGSISKKIAGKGWGYDPIFIPYNQSKTFAQINDKNKISHRYKALKKFSKWFLDRQVSTYQ